MKVSLRDLFLQTRKTLLSNKLLMSLSLGSCFSLEAEHYNAFRPAGCSPIVPHFKYIVSLHFCSEPIDGFLHYSNTSTRKDNDWVNSSPTFLYLAHLVPATLASILFLHYTGHALPHSFCTCYCLCLEHPSQVHGKAHGWVYCLF